MSVRLRLTLWYAGVLTAALALFGFLIYFSLHQRLFQEIDNELAGTSSRFETYFVTESSEESPRHLRGELEEFCQALPPSISLQVLGSDGFVFRYPAASRAQRNDVRLNDVRVLHRSFNIGRVAFELVTTASTAEALHTLQLLQILLLGLTPFVIAIACVGGAWMSRRALKPVHDITAAALTIGIENLSERLPMPPTRDEIARLSEVLNLMFARLESAVKTLSQFVADASHELRTPLAVIRATAEVSLRRERPAESYRASLEEIVAETERMTRLVEDLLALARADTQTTEMPLAPLDANEAVRAVCAEMTSLAEIRQIAIDAVLSGAPAIVSANPAALHRLLIVFVDNAIKFSPPGSRVGVIVSRIVSGDTAHVRIAVEDSGAGIDAASLPHIFTRFYRADPARTGPGHGLGLSLAESIARAHGVTIEVESCAGKGSRFSLTFPLQSEARRETLQGIFSFPR